MLKSVKYQSVFLYHFGEAINTRDITETLFLLIMSRTSRSDNSGVVYSIQENKAIKFFLGKILPSCLIWENIIINNSRGNSYNENSVILIIYIFMTTLTIVSIQTESINNNL